MELPHIGELAGGTYAPTNSSARRSTSASASGEARTRSINPVFLCVFLFQLSIASSTSSGWCTTSSGPAATISSCGSVTRMAISMMRSDSGCSPVISMSIQIRLFGSTAMLYSTWAHERTDLALPRRCGRSERDKVVARAAPDPPRARASRCGAGDVLRRDCARRAPEGRRLHRGEDAPGDDRGAGERGAAARLHARRADPVALERLGVVLHRRLGGARHGALALDLLHPGAGVPAGEHLSHLRHREPLRLQPHDGEAFRAGPGEARAGRTRAWRAAAPRRAVADGEDGRLVVALRLALLGRLFDSAHDDLPGAHPAAFQQVHADHRGRARRARGAAA